MSDQKVIVSNDDPHIKRSRQYVYYLKRIMSGRCGVGGCPEARVTGQYCEAHRIADLVRRKNTRLRKKAAAVK